VKFKIDENLPVEFADVLKLAGHRAMTVIKNIIHVLKQKQNKGRLWIAEETRIRIRGEDE